MFWINTMGRLLIIKKKFWKLLSIWLVKLELLDFLITWVTLFKQQLIMLREWTLFWINILGRLLNIKKKFWKLWSMWLVKLELLNFLMNMLREWTLFWIN